MRQVRGVTVTDTDAPAPFVGSKVHKFSPFSASKVLLLRVRHHFILCFLAQQSDLQYSFTSLLPISEKILMVLTFFLLKASDYLFQQILYLSIEVDFKYNSRIVFYFYSRFFRNKKTCVLIWSKIPSMWQIDFLKWHFWVTYWIILIFFPLVFYLDRYW